MQSPSSEIERQLREATGLHQGGKLEQAARLYEAILGADLENFDALHQFGILHYQTGRHARAGELLQRALAQNANSAPAWCNNGLVLQALGRPRDALTSYDQAIALNPNHAEVHNNRGNVLVELGQLNEALASHDEAVRLNPASPAAHANRGSVLRHLGRFNDALASYDRAIALKADYAEAYVNRAITLAGIGRPDEAISNCRAIIAMRPDDAVVHNALARLLTSMNRLEDAFVCANRALALQPDFAEAHRTRGILLETVRRYEEALASYDRLIALSPNDLDAHGRRAYVLFSLRRPDEALTSYERVLAINPDDRFAFGGIANAALHCCDWRKTEQVAQALTQRIADGHTIIEPLAVLGYDCSPQMQLKCASKFSRFRLPALPEPLRRSTPYSHEKIRLAYLSADFRRHPVAYQISELFELHDRTRFELIGVSFGPDDGTPMRKRIVSAFDEFLDVRNTGNFEVAKLLREREVDIAIDLMGYTTSERVGILSHRPAPIQAQYLGFPGTMGTDFIDYIIADPLIMPFDRQPFCAERIVHLPDCYLVNDKTRAIAPETPIRESAGLPETGFVFCCFNTSYKITSPVFDVWMRLLHRVEGSVLWLPRDNDTAQRHLIAEAQARGIAPSRLVFAERLTSSEDHLARHRLADLFLDTLPYNAHSTGASALWTGLPFITCMGETMQSRIGASILRAAGLPQLVTQSLEEYERLAVRLATHPSELAAIRRQLQQDRLTCPLFDTDRFRRHIEAAYTRMWELHRQGQPPESFAVPA